MTCGSREKVALTGVLAIALLFGSAVGARGQSPLGDGRLQIIGTGLDISPEAQTVPIGVPTRVDARLPLSASAALPPTLSVRGELNGPGLTSTLALSAPPNGFFTIPAQTARGTYVLSDIRLVDGDTVVAYAAHRDATITVTDILVTQVTSRPLTYQEMVDKGIVISQRDFRGFAFSFSITIESRVISFAQQQGSEEEGPHAVIDFLQPDLFAGEGQRQIEAVSFPSDRAVAPKDGSDVRAASAREPRAGAPGCTRGGNDRRLSAAPGDWPPVDASSPV